MRKLETIAGRRRKRRKSFFLNPTDAPGDRSDSPRGRAAERQSGILSSKNVAEKGRKPVFKAPSLVFLFLSQSRKQILSDDSLLLNFEHVKRESCSGGLMESLQEQEAKPRFMFDGRKMIGGSSAEAGT